MKSHVFTLPLLLCGISSASTLTWKGGTAGAQNQWTTAANWMPSTFPSASHDVVFPPGAPFIGTVKSVGPAVQSITVSAPGYSFESGSGILSGLEISAGITVSFAATGSAVFELNLFPKAIQTFTADGGRLTVFWNGVIYLDGQTIAFDGNGIHQCDGVVTLPGNLIKSGTGRIQFNGSILSAGSVAVYSGTAEFNHDIMEKDVTLAVPGRLAGTGRVKSLNAHGTVAPGSGGPGTLKVTETLVLQSDATLEIGFVNNAPGQMDLIQAGNVTLNGATLSFTVGSGYYPFIGSPHTIITNFGAAPVSGTFAGLPEGAIIPQGNVSYRISYTGGDGGNDVTVTPVAAAPTGITRVWNGFAGPQMSFPGSWDGGISPRPGDSIIIPALSPFSSQPWLNYADGYPLHRITITGGGIELTGGAPHLSDGIVQQAPPGTDANVVTCGLHPPVAGSPAAETRILLQSGGDLTVSGPGAFGLPGAAASLRLENVSPNGVLVFQQAVSGAGKIGKFGAGTAYLKSARTHAGGLAVHEGTLVMTDAAAAGPGLVTVDAFAALLLGYPGSALSLNVTNTLHLAGTLGTGNISADQEWSGPIHALAAASRIRIEGGALLLRGPLTGPGGFTFSRSVFAGNNTINIAGNAPATYAGATTIEDVGVICDKNPGGQLALAGNVTVTGGGGQLTCLKSNSIPAGASLNISGGAQVTLWQQHTIGSVVLIGGSLGTGGCGVITMTGNLNCLASATGSLLTGKVFTGAAPVTWTIGDGPPQSDLIFIGSIGHTGGSTAAITKAGTGLLRGQLVHGNYTDLSFTLNAGTLEWNDQPATPGPFGPDVHLNGGTLTGSGRVRDITGTAGTLSPGDTVGNASMTCDSLTMGSSVTFLAMQTGGIAHQLIVEGGLVDTGTATLAVNAPLLPVGTEWLLVDNRSTSAVSDSFEGLQEGTVFPAGGNALRITYAGGDRNDIVLTRIEPPAPEITGFDLSKAISGTGPLSAEGTGLPGFTYRLEHSPDLQQWFPATDETAEPDGTFHLEWLPPAPAPRRFFRIRRL